MSQQEILAALNAGRVAQRLFTSNAERLAFGRGDMFTLLDLVATGGDIRRAVSMRLRALVDEWIDTGIIPGVGEHPANRSLLRAPNATRLLRDYARLYRARLLFFPKFPEFIVEGDSEGSLPEHPDATDRALSEATRLFAGMMMSDWKDRLCKCRDASCGKYVVKERLRKTPYKHGTFCEPKHLRAFSARVKTKEARAMVTNDLIELAAKKLLEWRVRNSTWQADYKLKKRLASELLIVERRSANWVTLHRQEIEQRRAERARG